MEVLDYIRLGILAVFNGPELFSVIGVPVSVTIVMILFGFLLGIAVGSTPGLAGPSGCRTRAWSIWPRARTCS